MNNLSEAVILWYVNGSTGTIPLESIQPDHRFVNCDTEINGYSAKVLYIPDTLDNAPASQNDSQVLSINKSKVGRKSRTKVPATTKKLQQKNVMDMDMLISKDLNQSKIRKLTPKCTDQRSTVTSVTKNTGITVNKNNTGQLNDNDGFRNDSSGSLTMEKVYSAPASRFATYNSIANVEIHQKKTNLTRSTSATPILIDEDYQNSVQYSVGRDTSSTSHAAFKTFDLPSPAPLQPIRIENNPDVPTDLSTSPKIIEEIGTNNVDRVSKSKMDQLNKKKEHQNLINEDVNNDIENNDSNNEDIDDNIVNDTDDDDDYNDDDDENYTDDEDVDDDEMIHIKYRNYESKLPASKSVLECLEGLCLEMRKEKSTKANPAKKIKPPPLDVSDFYKPGENKVEIHPECGFHMNQSLYELHLLNNALLNVEPIANRENPNVESPFKQKHWSKFCREIILEVYGTNLKWYSVSGTRGKYKLDQKLLTGLLAYINARLPKNEIILIKKFKKTINNSLSRKRWYQKKKESTVTKNKEKVITKKKKIVQ